jgi:hypothetical protein
LTLARCRVPDMSVRTLDGFGERFGLGAVIDLDAQVGESGLTYREALAERVDLFELVDAPNPDPGLPTDVQE